MPNRPWPGRGAKTALERAAQRRDSSIARSTSASGAGKAMHSSSTMVMVASKRCWISTERSGVSSWRLPSWCELNTTPRSVSLRRSASDMTW